MQKFFRGILLLFANWFWEFYDYGYLINITYLWYEFKFNLKNSREDAQRVYNEWLSDFK